MSIVNMAGHSHAKKVRKIKEADAKRRGQIFSKLTRLIQIAVRDGGPNPEVNPKLRMAIEMAKSYNFPAENIERAIKKATGEIEAEKLEEFSFEAIGTGGVALIIEGITDNKNRTLNEIKQILNRHNAKLVGEGSVKWMFQRMGCVSVNLANQDKIKEKGQLELLAIDCGAEDLEWDDGELNLYCPVENLENLRKNLEKEGVKIESTSIDWKPKERKPLQEKEKS
ncbi:YebC/PmpR family DNA-binding transcriptional regulator, partial [Candidatus Parcubacteria bacterium]|nr:YebC/PmpR family DNA-binding transcriptional regulator [Candidatus Parcubacteria bacterium]